MAKPDSEILEKILKRYQYSYNERSPIIEKHKEYYSLYKSWRDRTKELYTYEVFVPYTFALVEEYASRTLLAFLTDEKFYNVRIRGWKFKGNAQKLCRDIAELLDYFIKYLDAELMIEFYESAKHAYIYGVGINACYPNYNVSGKLVYFNMDMIPFIEIFPDFSAKRWRDTEFIILKRYVNKEIVKNMAEEGVYDNIKDEDLEYASYTRDEEWLNFMADLGWQNPLDLIYDNTRQKVEVMEYFLPSGHVITVLGRRKIIRNTTEDNTPPFEGYPLIPFKCAGAPGELLGISIVEQIKPLQIDLNILRSQRRRNVELILNKVFIANILADIDYTTLISKPGNIVLTSDIDAIRELPITDTTGSAFREEQILIGDIQNVSSITDYWRGQVPRRRETATTVVSLQRMAQGRFEANLKLINLQLFTFLAFKTLSYIRREIDRDTYTLICGEDNAYDVFKNITIEEFKRYFHFVPTTTSITGITEVDRQQFIQVFPMLARSPHVNRLALEKQLLELFNIKNIQDLLPEINQQANLPLSQEMQFLAQNPQIAQLLLQQAQQQVPPEVLTGRYAPEQALEPIE